MPSKTKIKQEQIQGSLQRGDRSEKDIVSDLKRRLGKASGSVDMTTAKFNREGLSVHPAVLDAAFHSIILAFSYPKDGQVGALHLPTRISKN